MTNISAFIESGILELYVFGIATPEQIAEVGLVSNDQLVRREIDAISTVLEQFAFAHAIAPSPTIKPFLMATLDFTHRMESGEEPAFPPELNEGSEIAHYAEWLNRADMVLPDDFKDYYAKIIGHTPAAVSAIVWIDNMAPEETHHDEYEKFLIVEGTCDITIGSRVHHLVPGNYLAIPLHIDHHVVVTSAIPCKVILQRIAA